MSDVRKSLRLLTKNERITRFFERIAQNTNEGIPKPEYCLFFLPSCFNIIVFIQEKWKSAYAQEHRLIKKLFLQQQ